MTQTKHDAGYDQPEAARNGRSNLRPPDEGLDPQLKDYLRRGWLIFPCSWRPGDKRPLITGGFYGATRNPDLVASWWRRWPLALCAIRTGKWPDGSGVVITDIDRKYDGFNTLARLIGPELPPTPRVHTPSDGLHLWFQAPSAGCFSTVGPGGKWRKGLGPGVDCKADLNQCHAPGGSPSSPYRWDPQFNLETVPLLPLPRMLTPIEIADEEIEIETPSSSGRRRAIALPDAYGAAALKAACGRIREAVPGTQRNTLNAESYAIGRLAAGLDLDRQALVDGLVEAGLAMQQAAGRPPWRPHEVREIVREAFKDGLRKPHTPNLRSRSPKRPISR
jgi:hypothetical protein